MATDTLNRAKYAGLDFKTITDDLLARIQVQFAADFNDFAVSSMSIVLLDVIAFGLDTLSFYLDRRASDTYLPTARTRSSVAKLARALGYKMGGAIAASVSMQVNLGQVFSFPITVPKGFQFQGPNGLVFETSQDTVIPASTPTTTLFSIPCYQGATLSETFTADSASAKNQVFTLRKLSSTNFVVFGTVAATVDGVAWSEQPTLTYDATNQFEVGYNDSPPTIRFGDGSAGNIPANSSAVVVTYVASAGKAGTAAKGTITSAVQSLVVNFTSIPLTITNPASSIAGDDPESAASAQTQAPNVFKSRRVAITQTDYESLAGSYADPLYGRVSKAKAYLTRNATADLALQTSLQLIQNAVTAPVSPVAAAIADGNTKTADLVTQTTNLSLVETIIQASTDSADAALVVAIASDTANKSFAAEVVNDASAIAAVSGVTGTASNYIAAITNVDANPENIKNATKAQLLAYLASISSSASLATSNANSITTALTSVITNMNSVRSLLALIGTSPTRALSSSQLYVLDQAVAAIVADKAALGSDLSTISTQTNGAYTSVTQSLLDVQNHFTAVLSNESQTNLVTVPILSLDTNGFYAAPTTALIKSLQAFLNGVKEVTQTVIVTSGATFLLPAVISVRLGVSQNASQSQTQVQATVSSAIDSILKGREISASLYESDFDAIKDISGVGFFNVTIKGYLASDNVTILTDKLDQSGNLIAPPGYAITKGTVTITPETAPV